MLLPDNIHPENSIYYNGALVLDIIQQHKRLSIFDLYLKLREETDVSFPILVLCLDWLYLIDAVNVNKKGEVKLCS
jgi:hypothetical protein